MRILWLVLATIALAVVGLCPSAAVLLNDIAGVALGVAGRGVLAVLEQPSIQVLAVLGIVGRLLHRRWA